MPIIPLKLDFKGWSVICLIYLIKIRKKKAFTGKEITKIIFIVIAAIIIIFNIVDRVVNIKGLSMIDVVYVIQIKIAYTEKYKPLKYRNLILFGCNDFLWNFKNLDNSYKLIVQINYTFLQ